MTNPMFDLSGKVAIITGSTKGIGKSIAWQMAQAGAKVTISSRKADLCDEVTKEFTDAGLEAISIPCNVSSKEAMQHLIDTTLKTWGRLDIVVGNAAANPYAGPLQGLPDDALDKVMSNNIKSNIWLAQMTMPLMAQNKDGAFIIVSSIGGLKGSTELGAYAMTKAADINLVRSLALEWGPSNIRVNAICPGLIMTNFARLLWEDPNRREKREGETPLRRLGEPDDIGGVAVFLASRAGSFVTGQAIVADGGVLA